MSAKILSDVKPKLGQLVRVENQNRKTRANKEHIYVKVINEHGHEEFLALTDHAIKCARKRTASNPEDVPVVSWFRDKVVESITKRI